MGSHPGAAGLGPKAQAGAQTAEDFFALILPHVNDLRDHARRELKILEIEGTLHPGEVTTADLVDEVLARGWQQFADRPKDASLKTWLVDLLHVVLGEWINQELRPHESLDAQIDDVLPEDVPQVDDQEWWMVLLGYDDTQFLTDIVDEAQAKARWERLETEARKNLLTSLVVRLPRQRRNALLLSVLKNYSPAEIASLQHRDEADVRADIDAARQFLQRHLSAADDGSLTQREASP